MELNEAIEFARTRDKGVLTTIRGNGRPQLSNIVYNMGADGSARISVTGDRAKTRNLRRDPRASLYVPGDSFWAYCVLDGTVALTPEAGAPDDAVVDQLVDLYRSIRGEEHPDWDEYRTVMAEEHRVVATIRPDHAYGLLSA